MVGLSGRSEFPHLEAEGIIIAKQNGVIADLRCAELAFKLLEETSHFEPLVKDGEWFTETIVVGKPGVSVPRFALVSE